MDSCVDGESAFGDIFQVCQKQTVTITCHLSVLQVVCTVTHTLPGSGVWAASQRRGFCVFSTTADEHDINPPPPLLLFAYFCLFCEGIGSPSEFLPMQLLHCP